MKLNLNVMDFICLAEEIAEKASETVKDIRTTEGKRSVLHLRNRKTVLKTKFNPLEAPPYEDPNLFERRKLKW